MIRAVIGAGYGDEGKGLLTDFLVGGSHDLVVRHNGGAQAGHTVVLPDGRRHEFHHVGAGSFKGASTLLGRHFVVNPVLFRREFEALAHVGVRPGVFVDRHARVTLPFDMMLNCAKEEARGQARHGSCGVGINETVTRHAAGAPCDVKYLSTASRRDLIDYVEWVRDAYVPPRAADLGIAVPTACDIPGLVEQFLNDCEFFIETAIKCDDYGVLWAWDRSRDVVFEGAQGLRLDEHADEFPHVTRSRTGLPNVLELLDDAERGQEPIDVRYVTRCYVTRHGAGPLDGELPDHPWGWTGPETNVYNERQGRLRYGQMSAQRLAAPIARDLHDAQVVRNILPSLTVTCLDQAEHDGTFDVSSARSLARVCGIPLAATSHGPTRDDVRSHQLVSQ